MGNLKLKSKGVRIEVNIKKGRVNSEEIVKSLRSQGFKISPPIPNMPTLAISSNLKSMIGNDNLEIQAEEYQKFKSKSLRNLIEPYTVEKNSYNIQVDATFLVSGKLDTSNIINSIYNPRAQSKAKLYVEPVGFRVIIKVNEFPFVLSFEGTKSAGSAVTTISFSTEDVNQFFDALEKLYDVINNFLKKANFFARNEISYRRNIT